MCLLLTTAGLLLAFSLGSANAVCQPGIVGNITYNFNNTLVWKTPANPNNCTITSYVVFVTDNEDNTKYQFETNGTILNYTFSNFLEICKSYTFEVHALTKEYVLGPSELYNATIVPMQNLNLTLSALNVTTNASNNEVNLTWYLLDTQTSKCISYYRVVYWDKKNTPKDNYVHNTSFSLKNDIPCKNYTVQVNAIVTNPIMDGPISECTVQIPQKAPANPSLSSIATSNTTVQMVWKVQPLAENCCNLTALNIYTLGVPANISHVVVPIVDSDPRPNVNFTLTGLDRAHVYTSLVNVQNHAGTSENVTVVFQTGN
ncbi:titin-like [Euwallacea fornicatus]|uniref:titin-like n=1 Tax=Euwallacea fornicatus TaxID=995702 RepID=UPI00338F931E